MAVTSLTEDVQGEGGMNALYQRTYTRNFLAVCNDRHDGPAVILSTTGTYAIPAIGDFYAVNSSERDTASFVNDIKFRRKEITVAGVHWIVTVSYGPYSASTFPRDPTAWPIKAVWGSQKYQRPAFRALDGSGDPTVAVVNSAGDPFSDPIEVDDTRVTLTVTRNERVVAVPADPLAIPPTAEIPAFSLDLIKLYRDTVNDATWNGADIGTIKCNSITPGEPQQSPDGFWFVPVVYVFEERLEGWKKTLLDQGYAELDGSSPPVAKQIKGKDGQPIHEPVPLDGSGHKLAHGADAVYLEFDVYKSMDFSVFNIDLSARLGTS